METATQKRSLENVFRGNCRKAAPTLKGTRKGKKLCARLVERTYRKVLVQTGHSSCEGKPDSGLKLQEQRGQSARLSSIRNEIMREFSGTFSQSRPLESFPPTKKAGGKGRLVGARVRANRIRLLESNGDVVIEKNYKPPPPFLRVR